jgi:hypothetical protein
MKQMSPLSLPAKWPRSRCGAVAVAPQRPGSQKLGQTQPISNQDHGSPSTPTPADGLPHASWPGLAGLLLAAPSPWRHSALRAENWADILPRRSPAKSNQDHGSPSTPTPADGLPHAPWPGLAGLLHAAPSPWRHSALRAENWAKTTSTFSGDYVRASKSVE